MDPNAYPPLPPQQPVQNPYDFLNAPQNQKRSFIGGGGQKQRTLIAIIFVLVVLTVVAIVASIFVSASKKDYKNHKTALEQQTEIIRIADQGSTKARTAEAKNYASTIKAITTSEKTDTLNYLKTAKVKVDDKALAIKKDANNDKLLSAAEQANQYDEKLIALLNQLLGEYHKNIKLMTNGTTSKAEKSLVTLLQNDAKVIGDVK